ncbi:unnamed protein product [Didymodactylos carnosus]|uniref:Uncharacterized protein n=1 Tax=Didymodactylos carnosus TaxID=1234261 RepID=A0A815VVU6_9BILA|nr:unnamed protein product [Didymodactylos carnosus]CAF4397077.1 unnamed protein product [Didymodactylos carnosus]
MNEDDCIIINQEEDYTTCPALQPLNQRTPVRSRASAHPRTPLRKSTTSLRDHRMPEIRRKVLLLPEIPPGTSTQVLPDLHRHSAGKFSLR